MRAINEQKQLLQDLDCLLNKMEQEIDILRNINYRYYLMHGNRVQNGLITVPENISFYIREDKEGDVECRIIDHDVIHIESNYQKIKREILKLK